MPDFSETNKVEPSVETPQVDAPDSEPPSWDIADLPEIPGTYSDDAQPQDSESSAWDIADLPEIPGTYSDSTQSENPEPNGLDLPKSPGNDIDSVEPILSQDRDFGNSRDQAEPSPDVSPAVSDSSGGSSNDDWKELEGPKIDRDEEERRIRDEQKPPEPPPHPRDNPPK